MTVRRPRLARRPRLLIAAAAVAVAAGIAVPVELHAAAARDAAACTLDNPIGVGADPSVVRHDGHYYLAQSDGQRSITITRSRTIAGLGTATPTVIWTAPAGTDHSAETWAPEIEYLRGRWVVYFAAATDRGGDPATNATHRVFALTADTADATGHWSFAGGIVGDATHWAIDPSVFRYRGSWWMTWSGTPAGNGGDAPQQITIARMTDPLHVDASTTTTIGRPTRAWEHAVQAIEEGPEPWVGPDGTLTIVYNADASWTSHYALGELVHDGSANLTDPSSWGKRGPVLTSGGHVTGPGGESAPVRGPGGVLWNIYHAKTGTQDGWDDRALFAAPVHWRPDGTPDFGGTAAGTTSFDEQTGRACR
ncbi:family 43 glycosylhydrolase [Curtobacterium sp. ISL-83]|uniref:family 43 glycosylhydrolase n=1 Tax=Curtobacterium sp. ISL-83 TaxID=2819145 RepID=UPI001BE8EFEE|nr:family 43 glycosylhydrolase [Curtobacterium sp. ISL-83]MBT2503539.1 family 43 glycosylhydrolase [Curtobacterium sp. ISL-83]